MAALAAVLLCLVVAAQAPGSALGQSAKRAVTAEFVSCPG